MPADPRSAAIGSEFHPHEPEIPKALDEDGRCWVCHQALEIEKLRQHLAEIKRLASDPFASDVIALRACLLAANEALGLPGPESSPERDIAREIIRETLQTDRYQDGGSPHKISRQPPRHENVRGRDMTEVPAMQENRNDLHIRVTYSTYCPEWWRIQVRRRIGKQGLATREECVEWLRRYGQSEDDNLALAFERWQQAAAEGEEVEWA